MSLGLPTAKQEELVRRAMVLAAEASEGGDLPFAGILVDEAGNIVLEAKNTVNSTNNAAAHAEINLLYAAGKKLRTNNLNDYILVSNAASCPMCITAFIKAKVTRFYYGAPNESTMIPNITIDEVLAKAPSSIEVYGGILTEECAAQVRALARR